METYASGGTWESLSLLLTPFLFPQLYFFPMLFCFPLISDSLHPINIGPCKHKRSQYVGANENVTWQLISGSRCFPAWFMCNSKTTLTEFDLVSVSQFMGRLILRACLEHETIHCFLLARLPLFLFHLWLLTKFQCQIICQPHTAPLSYITDTIWLHNLFLNHFMNIKDTNLLYIWERTNSAAPASNRLFQAIPTFLLWCINTVLGSFSSSGSPARNFLLCSHFPTITEVYKLP